MYRFIFEDADDSILSTFYRKFYPKTNTLEWTGGNSQMMNLVLNNPVFGDEYCILFFDFNPWNRNISNIYKKMCKKIRRTGYHYIIIPIICSEYKYLRSLDEKYLTDKNIFKKLLSVNDLDEILSDNVHSYEAYCKLLAYTHVTDNAKLNQDLGIIPKYVLEDTEGDGLYYKWVKYIVAYDIVPVINGKLDVSCVNVNLLNRDISLKDIVLFQNSRVCACNKWIESVNTSIVANLPEINIDWFK